MCRKLFFFIISFFQLLIFLALLRRYRKIKQIHSFNARLNSINPNLPETICNGMLQCPNFVDFKGAQINVRIFFQMRIKKTQNVLETQAFYWGSKFAIIRRWPAVVTIKEQFV